MSFTKITTTELNSRGATTLPNQPAMSATALKQEFDAPAKNIVAPKFNNLVDELEATTAAASLGAVAPTGRVGNNVQGIMNSISTDLDTLVANTSTAIAEAHAHPNKALLDDYTQTEADLADAVLQKHSHPNKALLDDYTQTETDLADAVLKRHTHGNKAALDKISESSGKPTYDGKDISGSLDDAFNQVVVGTTTLTANGASQFELKAGLNITLLPNPADNSIEIVSSGGGGGGAGDMTKATYDPNNHGYVDKAAGVTDGTNVLTYNTLNNKANAATSLAGYGITDAYTKTEADDALNNKANAATSLAGYGITDAYTKTEADDAFLEAPAAGVTAGEVIRADGSSGVNWETVDSAPTSASAKLVTSGGVYTALTAKANKSVLDAHLSRTPRDISSEIGTNGATLLAAIAEQNLEKYGFKIGDYFMSPANRSLVTQTYSSGNVTTQTVSVKLRYYIADMDTWFGGYDSYEVVGTHHASILVDAMVDRQWHSAADITSVGYNLSALYNYTKGDILNAIKADMKALFGGSTGLEHLLSHQLYLTKSFTACEWVSTYIHTPSEFEVYGGNAFSGNDAQKYAFNKKLALFDKFRFNQILGSGNSMWLYNMYTASNVCRADYYGRATTYSPVITSRAAGLILLH